MQKRLQLLVLALLLSNFLFGQDYSIKFRNKTIAPPKEGQQTNDSLLQSARYGDNYYLLVQFYQIPNENQKKELKEKGFRLGMYIQQNTYTVVCPASKVMSLHSSLIRTLIPVPKEVKTDAFVFEKTPNYTQNEISLTLQTFPHSDIQEAIYSLQSKGIEVVWKHSSMGHIGVKIHGSRLWQIEQLATILYIEAAAPENESYNLPGTVLHRANILNNMLPGNRGLKGKGVILGEWDGAGLGVHIDLQGRTKNIDPFVAGTGANHATHVAGTVLGAGNLNPYSRGMAPESQLFAWDFIGNVVMEMDTNLSKYNYVITQNSYGYTPAGDPCTVRGRYDGNSYGLDVLVNNNPYLLHVYANGNARSSNCIPGGYRTVASGYQCAKNVLTVGAVTDADGNSTFHSYGPALDGRLKPDVCGMGVNVVSTMPGNGYSSMNGTSMACPGVSGTSSLLYEHYRKLNANQDPAFHTIKAALCNTAFDLGNFGPDFIYGYGRVDGDKAARVLENNWYVLDSVGNQDSFVRTLNVNSSNNSAELKIFLCWMDVPALSSTGAALVNDLDLVVIDPNGDTIRPYVPDHTNVTAVATRKIDTLNTNEQVVILNPLSGNYKVVVLGSRVPSGPSHFTLTWFETEPFINMIFPMGGEKWYPPSNASRARRIVWDGFNVRGKLKLEFSADSGATWTTLVSNLDSNVNSWLWNNASPSIHTHTALIRVVSTDTFFSSQSQNVFTIMENPKSIGPDAILCSERITLTWPKDSNFVAARVYMLVGPEMEAIGTTKDTFFVVKNLTDAQAYWFAIAGIDSNGAEGIRSLARAHIPNGPNTGPQITQQPFSDSVCAGMSVLLSSSSTASPFPQSRWEFSSDSGVSWDTMPYEQGNTLHFPGIITDINRFLFRNAYFNSCGGFEYTDTVHILVDTSILFTQMPQNLLLCEGDTASFEVDLQSIHHFVWSWEKSINNGTTFQYISASDSQWITKIDSVDFSKSGNMFRVNASNLCGTFYSDTASLVVRPPLSLVMPKDTILCTGETIEIAGIPSGGDTLNYSYTWQPTASNDSLLLANPSISTTYVLNLWDNCSSIPAVDSVRIERRDALVLQITSSDTTVCIGSPAEINSIVTGGNPLTYDIKWIHTGNSASITENFIPTQAGFYGISVTDNCSEETPSDSIYIDLYAPLKVSIDPIDSICYGQVVGLQARSGGGLPGAASFNWDNGSSFDSLYSVSPLTSNTYKVVLSDGCTVLNDTANIAVLVRAPLAFTITNTPEVCSGSSASVNVSPSGGVAATYSYSYNPNIGSGPSFSFIPANSQKVIILLEDACSNSYTDSFLIQVNPLPSMEITATPNPICQNRVVNFEWTGTANGAMTRSEWKTEGKKFATDLANTSYAYTKPGTYSVDLTIIDSKNCKNDTTFLDLITVEAMPIPDFTFNPLEATLDNPNVFFTNTSKFASSIQWNFGQGWFSNNNSEQIEFGDTGNYLVTLTATNSLGCDSSITKIARVNDVFKLFVPTAFSPDGNNWNEEWRPIGRAIRKYNVQVFDRWGAKVFESDSPLVSWKGSVNNQGEILPEGIYLYKIRIMDIFGVTHAKEGTISLIK